MSTDLYHFICIFDTEVLMVKKLIICSLMMVCLFSMAACGQQNSESENIQDVIDSKTYIYEKEGCGGSFTIQIKDDGTYTYCEGYLSSYIGMGEWVLDEDILILSDDKEGYPFVNRFRVDKDNLYFISENSSNFLYVKVTDGERFTSTSE